MIKYLLAILAAVIVIAGAVQISKPHPAVPKTLIGVFSCSKLLGIAIVTSDGEIHPYQGELTADIVAKLQHLVPADHQMAIHAPCGDAST